MSLKEGWRHGLMNQGWSEGRKPASLLAGQLTLVRALLDGARALPTLGLVSLSLRISCESEMPGRQKEEIALILASAAVSRAISSTRVHAHTIGNPRNMEKG